MLEAASRKSISCGRTLNGNGGGKRRREGDGAFRGHAIQEKRELPLSKVDHASRKGEEEQSKKGWLKPLSNLSVRRRFSHQDLRNGDGRQRKDLEG